jgi:hypothetical protein
MTKKLTKNSFIYDTTKTMQSLQVKDDLHESDSSMFNVLVNVFIELQASFVRL